jgi:pimeloyl-ACP methyl ester carboxylesterase
VAVTDLPAPVPLAHDTFGPSSGDAVVLLHAFPLERSMWRPVAERLAAAGARVVTVDLPGLGGSPLPPGPPSLDASADAVAALLDRLGPARAVVVGVSMGGYVTMALARRRPDLLAGVALVDTKAEADAEAARAGRERVAATVEAEGGTGALAPMLQVLLGATSLDRRPDVVERVRAGLAAARVEGVAWSQRAMAARPDSTGPLASLAVPAAVVVGGEDGLTPPEQARTLAAALPDAVLTVLPTAGHLSPLEDPDGVAAAVLCLLVRVRPVSAGPVSAGPAGGSAPPA